jgi:hypothetical protein
MDRPPSADDLRRAEEAQADAEAEHQLALFTRDEAVIEQARERMEQARRACERIRRERGRKRPA